VAPLAFFTRYAIYSTVTPRAGYGIPWYCTISLDVPKVWYAPIDGHSTRATALPRSPAGQGNCIRHSGQSSFILPLCRPWAVRFFSFVLGGLLKGFLAPVRLYVGFLRVWLSYAFLPISLGWWLVCG